MNEDKQATPHTQTAREKIRSRAASHQTQRQMWQDNPDSCPRGPHRGPEGPNEDMGQCPLCMSLSYSMRPWGETFGHHTDDCSLPIWHESYCVGGGEGHPEAPVIRG